MFLTFKSLPLCSEYFPEKTIPSGLEGQCANFSVNFLRSLSIGLMVKFMNILKVTGF